MATPQDEIRELQAQVHALRGLVEMILAAALTSLSPADAERVVAEMRKASRSRVLVPGADVASSTSAVVLAQAAYSAQCAAEMLERALGRSVAMREHSTKGAGA